MPTTVWNLSRQSHLGARDEQQDSAGAYDCPIGQLLVVADGMGGHSGGKQASEAALKAIADALPSVTANDTPQKALDRLAQAAHLAVQKIRENKATPKASSTLALLLLTPTHVHRATMGDTRVYWLTHSGKLEHSRDDSVAQMLVERGQITDDQIRSHPDRNRLTKSLANSDFGGLEHASAELSKIRGMIVASDGFWENYQDPELIELLKCSANSATAQLTTAVEKAVERAGEKADNTTALLLSRPAAERPPARKKTNPPRKKPRPPASSSTQLLTGFFIALNVGLIIFLIIKSLF